MGSALKLRSPAVLMAIGVVATLVLALLVVIALTLTGGVTAVSDNAPLIAAVIALGGVFTAQMVSIALDARREKDARDAQRDQWEHETEVNDRRAKADALQAYLDQMGQLLLDKDKPLRQSKEGDEVRTLARARTLTVLQSLDGYGRWTVVQFLYESRLVDNGHVIVPLRDANLQETEFNMADLEQLADALEGAYMPDGNRFDKDWAKNWAKNRRERDEEAEEEERYWEDENE